MLAYALYQCQSLIMPFQNAFVRMIEYLHIKKIFHFRQYLALGSTETAGIWNYIQQSVQGKPIFLPIFHATHIRGGKELFS